MYNLRRSSSKYLHMQMDCPRGETVIQFVGKKQILEMIYNLGL